MSIPFKGFCGPSYQLQDRFASIERCVNWYNAANESQDETKFSVSLEPCPGNKAFSALPVPFPFNQPCRGLLELRGRAYGVNGNVVFSIDDEGNYLNIGEIANDSSPVSMVPNGTGQIFVSNS